MAMQSRIKQMVDALRSSFYPSVAGVHPEGTFREILRHERAVAERNNHNFTVLAFYGQEKQFGTHDVLTLGQVLNERLRATDFIGWLDSSTIGVILPHTGSREASGVAEQICRKMTTHQVNLDYKLYLYPDEEYVKREKGLSSRGANHGECSLSDICVAPFPAWKRMLDIFLCLFGLIVFGPVMLLIAAGIKMIAPGPVLFKQERIGFRGKPFMLIKFRSMKLNADTGVHKEHLAQLMKSNVKLTKLDNVDNRLIPFGKIFRASGLDELPQLFNIIRGDMSFIGPRPCVPYEYDQLNSWHKHRFDTYPGLTGLWQVSGKNKTTFTEMMRLDIAYGLRRSLVNDFRILLRTFPAVMEQIRDCKEVKRAQ